MMPRNILQLFLCLLLLCGNIHCRIYAGAETASSVWSAMGPGSQLNICRELLRTAGWKEVLDNKDSVYSIIAPSNDAFLKLGEGRLEELNEPTHLEELKTIFAKHIYTGFLGHDELSASGNTRPSLSGKIYPVTKVGNKWYIGRALVVRDAIIARNGIVYVIDTVLE
jgi:uncharacterized surface protein with fasciclin (FAS1) repeats